MKKIFTLFIVAALAASLQVSAQMQTQMNGAQQSALNHFPVNESIVPQPVQSNGVNSLWMSYAAARAFESTNAGKHPSGWYFHLFPDSLGITCDGGCYYNNIHSVGVVLDPFSSLMQTSYGINWSQWNPYTVDSMALQYFYVRHTATNVVDTLIITMYTDETAGDLDIYLFSNQITYYGVDTVRWKQMLYDYTTNNPSTGVASNKQVIKVPLTTADTVSTTAANVGLKIIYTNNFSVSAGMHVVATGVQFKPGYAYVLGDTITSKKNDFMLLTYEENNPCTTPSTCHAYPTYTPGDWNCSFIARKSERYNFNGNSWDGFYLPTWAFTQAYSLEDMRFSYKITSLNVGLSESSQPVNGLKLYQNFPNPARYATLIKYDTESKGAVTIEVGDITGRTLMTLDEGTQLAGKHEVVIDLSGLTQGMYFYTLKANGSSLTRQMIVTK